MNTCTATQTLKLIDIQHVNATFTTSIEGFVTAGFPSPAGDYIENELNFKELFIRNESATFFARVEGYSFTRKCHPMAFARNHY
jgi:SOS-response transcriptional repressor LexA